MGVWAKLFLVGYLGLSENLGGQLFPPFSYIFGPKPPPLCCVHLCLWPFQCQKWSSSFGFKVDLQKHIQIVQEKIKLFKCILCSKSFGRLSHLKRHAKAVDAEYY
jgi:hypothetical protein